MNNLHQIKQYLKKKNIHIFNYSDDNPFEVIRFNISQKVGMMISGWISYKHDKDKYLLKIYITGFEDERFYSETEVYNLFENLMPNFGEMIATFNTIVSIIKK